MKKLLFSTFVLLTVLLSGCQKDDPIGADFTYQVIGQFSPCNVEFYTSSVSSSYSWSISGSSQTSTSQNPKFSFDTPGTYQVTLKISDGPDMTKTVVIPPKATKIKINSVVLTGYPMLKPNGGSWDINSGPDIFFKILGVNPSNTVLYTFNNPMIDVSSVKNLQFNITNGFTLNIVNDFYFLYVFDDDSPLNPDALGYLSFNPSVYQLLPNNYPASFIRTQNGITATLNVEWQ